MAPSFKAIPSTTPWSSCSGSWIECMRTWRALPEGWGPRRSVTLKTTPTIWFSFLPLNSHSAPQSLNLEIQILRVLCLLAPVYTVLCPAPFSSFCVCRQCIASHYIFILPNPSDTVNRVSFWLKVRRISFLSIFCALVWSSKAMSTIAYYYFNSTLAFSVMYLTGQQFPIFFLKIQDGRMRLYMCALSVPRFWWNLKPLGIRKRDIHL